MSQEVDVGCLVVNGGFGNFLGRFGLFVVEIEVVFLCGLVGGWGNGVDRECWIWVICYIVWGRVFVGGQGVIVFGVVGKLGVVNFVYVVVVFVVVYIGEYYYIQWIEFVKIVQVFFGFVVQVFCVVVQIIGCYLEVECVIVGFCLIVVLIINLGWYKILVEVVFGLVKEVILVVIDGICDRVMNVFLYVGQFVCQIEVVNECILYKKQIVILIVVYYWCSIGVMFLEKCFIRFIGGEEVQVK